MFYVGDVKAENKAVIYPKVSGKIIERITKEADVVKKGSCLFYIDRDEIGFQFEKAPIESPIDGIVGRIYVDVGTNVTPQIPVALVVNMDTVKIKIDVAEMDLPKIKAGQTAKVLVDAYPEEIFEGRVEQVSPVVDVISRTAPIEIEVPNVQHWLKPGMFARVKICVRDKEKILIIPRDAVIKEDSSSYVFVVKENDMVSRQKIEIGLVEDNSYEVIAGLNDGDLVVTMGNLRLKEGDVIEAVDSLD